MADLPTELNEFWKWAEKSPAEYAINSGYGEWETEYPNWPSLYKAAETALNNLESQYDSNVADLLIQALAIDNECERILDAIAESEIDISRFTAQVMLSDQSEARWQMAEALGQVNYNDRDAQLAQMILEDDDPYVKRRALLSLAKVNKSRAKEHAKSYVDSTDANLARICAELVQN